MLALLATLLGFGLHAFYLRGVAEDAFISFRFAQHLAAGHGLVWNIGEPPVEGYTNFACVLLCAWAIRAGYDVVLVSQLVGVAASIVTLVGTYVVAHRLLALPAGVALLPAVMLAVVGPFATWATSGMETSLFGMLVLVSVGLLISWAHSREPAQLAAASVTLLLATLTRPEGALAFMVSAAAVAAVVYGRPDARAWRALLPLALYLVPLAVYGFWRYSYFGFLLPNTFYAKTGGSIYQYLRGAKYVGLFAFHFVVLPFAPLLIALAWSERTARRWPAVPSFAVGLCAGLLTAFATYLVYVGGDYMAMYRFIVPLLPFVYLLLAVAACSVLASEALRRRRDLVALSMVVAVGLTAIHSTPVEARLFRKPDFMHGTYRGVQYERRYVARFTVIGRFFRDYKCRDSESIALEPIGAIPYYSGLVAHSAHGIVDPVIAHKTYADQTLGQGFPGHEKIDWLHAISKKPTYILFSRQLRAEPEPFPRYPDRIDALVRPNYRLRSAWLNDPANGESGYFTFLELVGARTLDC